MVDPTAAAPAPGARHIVASHWQHLQKLHQVRELNLRAEKLLTTDVDLARSLAQQAESQARQLGANEELALSLAWQGKAAFYDEHMGAALNFAQRAAELAESDGRDEVRAKALCSLAGMWLSLGLGQHAVALLESAVDALDGTLDRASLALLQSLLGGALAQLGQAERGRQELEAALAAFIELGMDERALEARHNLAHAAADAGRFEFALAMSDVASVHALRAGDWLHAHVEALACRALVSLGRAGEAVDRAVQAIATTPSPARGAYVLHLAKGRAELAAGRLEAARRTLDETLEMFGQTARPDDPALFDACAELCRELGDTAGAERASARARAARRSGSAHENLHWRLSALYAHVELQQARLRYGRVASERARLQAQMDHCRRLVEAEIGVERTESLMTDRRLPEAVFDPRFDGAAEGYALRYQPVVNLADGQVVAVEALLRGPGGAAPLEVVRRLEVSGEIASVSHWALRTAGGAMQTLQARFGPALKLVLNVWWHELMRPGFLGNVLAALEACDLAPSLLELDVDGLLADADTAGLDEPIARLRAAGVSITLDNFGRTPLPLTLLADLSVDGLKIDRTLLARLGRDGRHEALLASIARTADAMGLTLSASGIETAPQRHLLQSLGCGLGQGLLFAAPLTLSQISALPPRVHA